MSQAEQVAQAFHEMYERLAPDHGYETREASAKPWADVPEQNRSLMVSVVAMLIENGTILVPPTKDEKVHTLEFTFQDPAAFSDIDWTLLGRVDESAASDTKVKVEVDLTQFYSNKIAREIDTDELVAVVQATLACCGYWPEINPVTP